MEIEDAIKAKYGEDYIDPLMKDKPKEKELIYEGPPMDEDTESFVREQLSEEHDKQLAEIEAFHNHMREQFFARPEVQEILKDRDKAKEEGKETPSDEDLYQAYIQSYIARVKERSKKLETMKKYHMKKYRNKMSHLTPKKKRRK